MKRRLILLSLLALVLGCCHSDSEPSSSSTAKSNVPISSKDSIVAPAQDSIGSATMKDDGTIVLQLRAEGHGAIGDALLFYPPNHPRYNYILKHIGPIKPGENKPVPPWPSEDKPVLPLPD